MLDKEDLKAIGELIAQSEARTKEAIHQSENRMKTLIDHEVTPKLNLLAENQEIMMKKLERFNELDEVEEMLDVHTAALKAHNRELLKLKRAQ